MTLRILCSLAFCLMLGLSAASANNAVAINASPYSQFDWNKDYQKFQKAAKKGLNREAADIGDGFIEAAAADLNDYSPEFAGIAIEIAEVHEKNRDFFRAAELFSQAQTAYQYTHGYESKESYDALYNFARMSLAAKDYDRAISLYEETIMLAVIRNDASQIDDLRAGLAKSYAPVDPRVAQMIRKH